MACRMTFVLIFLVAPFQLRSTDFKPVFCSRLHRIHPPPDLQDPTWIRGLEFDVEEHDASIPPSWLTITCRQHHGQQLIQLQPLAAFAPGAIVLLETELAADSTVCLNSIKASLDLDKNISASFNSTILQCPSLDKALETLSLTDVNTILYKCQAEERDCIGFDIYKVPGMKEFAYAGLCGFSHHLTRIGERNDLGHVFCAHLRDGLWALEYLVHRLDRYLLIATTTTLQPFRSWLKQRCDLIAQLPNFLIPKYFSLLVLTCVDACTRHCIDRKMSSFIQAGTWTRRIALTSVSLIASLSSSALPGSEGQPTDPSSYAPPAASALPLQSAKTPEMTISTATLSAGLPHFSTGFMRCWGRDVFISLRGHCMLTGIWESAEAHLLSFASCMRHGLIPNLLDSGNSPRFNARDATWWFLQSIQDFCLLSPSKLNILTRRVHRRFYHDFVTIQQIILDILNAHWCGIHFEERNAGPQLDHAMCTQGFHVDIYVDHATGFIHGGNQWNCGTWMDKMGDSKKAGNFGCPATPRDGAAVEIVGLLKSTVRWLQQLHVSGAIGEEGVVGKGRCGW